MAAAEEPARLYPNCDAGVWLRSCTEELPEPIDGELTGVIPEWLSGSLIRNGPGSLAVGQERFRHLFDSSALLHRFSIAEGRARYQCRFLASHTRARNLAAGRVVVAEFGTAAVPDPCHTIFDRVAALFKPGESLSDNAMISVYPFGDQLYAFTEGPVIHRIDPQTLETCERRNLAESTALVNHTSHPHVMPNGDVYNVGMATRRGRLRHVVVHFPYTEKGDMFSRARVVASMSPRWPLHPAYMHSFGITTRYFVLVEQPLAVSLTALAKGTLTGRALAASLQWFPEHQTHVVLLSREDGKEVRRYYTSSLFFLHVINAFEDGDDVVVDLCTYKDPKVINAMYVDAMENMQSNAEYAEWFRARPRRLRLPTARDSISTSITVLLLADVGCETPRIHYDKHNGRPYRYFYAISSDVDIENPGTLIKVDTETGKIKTWCEPNCYPSEPVFVPAPNAQSEDDGVVLSALVWSSAALGAGAARRTALLVLDACTWHELARVVFQTPSPAPKCLHGWFLPNV